MKKRCPRCLAKYEGFPALSRRDNKTDICSDCGEEEALIDAGFKKPTEEEKSFQEWLEFRGKAIVVKKLRPKLYDCECCGGMVTRLNKAGYCCECACQKCGEGLGEWGDENSPICIDCKASAEDAMFEAHKDSKNQDL